MAGFAGKFRFIGPGIASERSGPCEFSLDAVTATLSSGGAPIAFDLGDVETLVEGEHAVSLSLFDGSVLTLSHLGRAFQTLVHDLREAHRARLVTCLLVSDLDEVARFEASLDGAALPRPCVGRGEVRLYESNVAFLLDGGGGFQWRLSDLEHVDFDERDYVVVVATREHVLRLGKLAKRTEELVERLHSRMAALKDRAGRALHAVMPFLSPSEFERVARLLREGVPARLAELRSVHRLVAPTLLEQVVDPSLRPYLAALVERAAAEPYIGWKIVRREPGASSSQAEDEAGATGESRHEAGSTGDATAVVEHEVAPTADRRLLDLGDGLEALFWYLVPLGAGGRVTHLAWEATSREGRATYVFSLPVPATPGAGLDAAVAGINDGLVALNFRRAPVYLPDHTLQTDARYRHYAIASRRVPELREVRQRFAGRAIHTSVPAWTAQLDRLVCG